MGTNTSNLIATFTLSGGASAVANSTAQVSGTSVNDFTNSVTYTVTAEDGSIQAWLVKVTFDPQTDILTFSFPEQSELALVNPSNHTVFIEVAPETNLTNLVASFTLSPGATAEINTVLQISGSTPNDFTNPLTYTIISSGAAFTQEWLVTVSLALRTETDFLSFSFIEQSGPAIINKDNHTIQIEVAFSTELTGLVATFSLSEGASASVNNESQQSGVTANDFTNPVTYTVTAEDGTTTQDWTVTVNISPNTETDFLSFNFAEQSDPAVVDSENHTVNIEVVFGTDLTELVTTFTLSPGARAEVNSIVQESGVTVNDFANHVTYRIIAADNLTFQDWVITVNIALNTETDVLSFSFVDRLIRQKLILLTI